MGGHLHTTQQQLQATGRVAAAAFWGSLHDFVGLRLCPAGWLDHIPPNHPFLCNAWKGEEQVLRVNRLAQPALQYRRYGCAWWVRYRLVVVCAWVDLHACVSWAFAAVMLP
jgi:hypothetical protein